AVKWNEGYHAVSEFLAFNPNTVRLTCLIMVRLAIRFGQSIPAIRVSFRLRLVSSHGLPTVRSRLVWSSPITYLPKRIKMPSPFPTGPVSSSHAQSSHALSRGGIPSQDQIT